MDREEDRRRQTDVVCVGEALWDLHTPEGTPFEEANHVALTPGGGAVNVALALLKLNVRAGLVAAIGDDPIGRALKLRLEKLGIDVTRVQASPTRTGLVFMTSKPTRVVAYRAPKEEALALASALPHAFQAKIVHLSGLLPDQEHLSALARAAERAKREGAIVMIDANLRPRLWIRDALAQANPSAIFQEADILKVSADDLRVLGVTNPDDARSLAPIVVLTDGPNTTRAWGPFGEIEAAVEPIEIPSAIGAGDAFVAGFLSTLALEEGDRSREAIERALRRGNQIAHAALNKKLENK